MCSLSLAVPPVRDAHSQRVKLICSTLWVVSYLLRASFSLTKPKDFPFKNAKLLKE